MLKLTRPLSDHSIIPMSRSVPGVLLLFLFSSSVAVAQMGPAAVAVAPVEKRPLELTQPLVASVEPVTRTILAAEQEGLVSERLFDEGQRVEKGAVLVRMNTDLVKIQRDAAQAALESAQGVLEQAKAEQDRAKRELERNRSLYETNVAPEKEFLDAQTAERVANATVAIETAHVAEQKAEVDRLDTILRKSEVRSPLDGVIARRHVEVGQAVRQWDPVAELVQLDPLFVRVYVPEQVISQVRVGEVAHVTIDALGGQTLDGKIEQVLPEADPGSRTFPVKILLPNEQMNVRPGFFARVTLLSRQIEDAVVVPKNAVVTQGQASRVVIAANGQAQVVPVQLLASDGEHFAIKPLQGEIKAGDLVVVRGNEMLQPGMPLQVLNSAPGGGAGGAGGAGGGEAPPPATPTTNADSSAAAATHQ